MMGERAPVVKTETIMGSPRLRLALRIGRELGQTLSWQEERLSMGLSFFQ
jgi:hypothetical protein